MGATSEPRKSGSIIRDRMRPVVLLPAQAVRRHIEGDRVPLAEAPGRNEDPCATAPD
jgi:hypothetical protein